MSNRYVLYYFLSCSCFRVKCSAFLVAGGSVVIHLLGLFTCAPGILLYSFACASGVSIHLFICAPGVSSALLVCARGVWIFFSPVHLESHFICPPVHLESQFIRSPARLECYLLWSSAHLCLKPFGLPIHLLSHLIYSPVHVLPHIISFPTHLASHLCPLHLKLLGLYSREEIIFMITVQGWYNSSYTSASPFRWSPAGGVERWKTESSFGWNEEDGRTCFFLTPTCGVEWTRSRVEYMNHTVTGILPQWQRVEWREVDRSGVQ